MLADGVKVSHNKTRQVFIFEVLVSEIHSILFSKLIKKTLR
jgi:hypothetical protein